MPVTINLKELFAADAQTMFTDKINYNFNKMLELGIGEQGATGNTGPTGSAGPAGNTGSPGQRGNKWFVGTNDPNGQTFPGLIDSDFYLETNSSAIWQYAAATDTWTQVTDLSQVIINIIDQIGSPFVRGIGETSPLDDRYILFAHRGNTIAAVNTDVTLGNVSDNDMLLLNNWNETVIDIENFPIDTNELFNSLAFISVDHSLLPTGRYHLEMGSTYSDPHVSPAGIYLSELNHNHKVRFFKEDVSGTSSTNTWINITRNSMSVPETVAISNIDQNAQYEFITPRFSTSTAIQQANVTLKIGGRFALEEYFPTPTTMVDGILITDGFIATQFGVLDDFDSSNNIPSSLYSATHIAAISVNNAPLYIDNTLMFDDNIFQSHGDYYQIPNSDLEIVGNDEQILYGFLTANQFRTGIASNGTYTVAIAGNPEYNSVPPAAANGAISTTPGGIIILDLQSSYQNGQQVILNADTFSHSRYEITANQGTDNHGQLINGRYAKNTIAFGYNAFPATYIRDIDIKGKYIYCLHARCRNDAIPPIFQGDEASSLTVLEIDSNINGVQMVGNLDLSGGAFEDYFVSSYRLMVSGKWAFAMEYDNTPRSVQGPKLAAIDITNPISPTFHPLQSPGTIISPLENMQSLGGDIYLLDFDISGEEAYVLSFDSEVAGVVNDFRLSVNSIDIHDPIGTGMAFMDVYLTGIQDPSDGKLLTQGTDATLASRKRGGISVSGNIMAIGWANIVLLFYRQLSGTFMVGLTPGFNWQPMPNGPGYGGFDMLAHISGTPSEYQILDIKVEGEYIYVLATYNDTNRGSLSVLRYNTSSGVEFINETTHNEDVWMYPNRMDITGEYINVTTVNSTRGGIITFKKNSVDVSSMTSGSIKTSGLTVLDNANFGNNVNIGNSVNIGSGGLYIDKGQGISCDGPIQINISQKDPLNQLMMYPGSSTNLTMIADIDDNIGGYNLIQSRAQSINVQSAMHRVVRNADSTFNGNMFVDHILEIGTNNFGQYCLRGRHGFIATTTATGDAFVDHMTFGSPAIFAESLFQCDDFTGYHLDLQSNTTVLGDAMGHWIRIWGNTGGSRYGIKMDLTAGATGGTKHGFHIEGDEENHLDGSLNVEDGISIASDNKKIREIHGAIGFTYNTANPGGPAPFGASHAITNMNDWTSAPGMTATAGDMDTAFYVTGGGFITVSLPGAAWNPLKTVVTASPRYALAGGGDAEAFNYTIAPTPGVNAVTFYLRRNTALPAITVGQISFQFSIIEQA